MTREEEIRKQADRYTDDASNYAEWSDDGCSVTAMPTDYAEYNEEYNVFMIH